MSYRYSRKEKVEEKKNVRKAFLLIVATVGVVLLFFFFGLPMVVKFSAFLTDIRKSSEPVEVSDTTPPPPPRFDPIPEFTNKLEVDIKGSTEPGVSVILYLNNKIEEIVSDSDGHFSHTFKLNKGKNSFSSLAKDKTGNESQETNKQTVTFDDQAPELTITKPEDGSEFYGSKERQVVIEGETEEDVSVSINGRKVVVDSDGTFAFATTLSEGQNEFKVKAEDEAGNTTEETVVVSYAP